MMDASDKHILQLIMQIISILLLISCSSANDVKNFVDNVKKTKTSNINPLPPLKEYELISYSGANLRDPFNIPLNNTIKLNTPQAPINIVHKRPDADRKREYLETMPLDSFTMIGTMSKQGEIWALIIDKTGIVHKVKRGNYLGNNSGKIKKITNNEIEIEELVNDTSGNWVNRKVNLSINNSK